MPRKTADYARELYQPGESLYLSKAEKERLGHIVSLAGSHHTILDIGCYDGTIAGLLQRHDNRLYGIEINPQVAALARERGMEVSVQDIESKFNYADGFFDVVVAGEVIEHILDTDFFMDEIKRVLKPEGFVVISTPNVASFGRRLFLLLGKNPYFEASLGFPDYAHAGHIRFFTRDLLLSFLKHKGFCIQTFCSDIINFNGSGSLTSVFLARTFPSLGRSLIVKASKS